jgi:ribosomal protein L23
MSLQNSKSSIKEAVQKTFDIAIEKLNLASLGTGVNITMVIFPITERGIKEIQLKSGANGI